MNKPRRFRLTYSLADDIADETELLREQVKTLQPGAAQDDILKRIRQNETAAYLSQWLTSRGLRPPM